MTMPVLDTTLVGLGRENVSDIGFLTISIARRSLPAAQLRVARRLDPVGAPRGRGEEHAVRPTEAALQLGAREQRRQLRVAGSRYQRQPVERARRHLAIDQFEAGIAELCIDDELRILEGPD